MKFITSVNFSKIDRRDVYLAVVFVCFCLCLQKKDVERTIGIDTDYIETNDFNLEPADKLFLVEVSPELKM